MEGSADEIGAPDSWEMVDLDQRMSRLMILSSKNQSEATSTSSSSCSNFPVERSGGISDEALNQVDQFLKEALEKPRERLSILRMEQDVEKLLRDPNQQQLEFRALPTSYLRLAAHRMAQHYCLQSLALPDYSVPDGTGSRIVLCKTPESRFPLIRLADIPVNLPWEDANNDVKVAAIKQRPQKGSQNARNSGAHSSKNSHLKSVEERKEEYNRARARIFSPSSSNSSGIVGRLEPDPFLEDDFPYCPTTTSKTCERFPFIGVENNTGRGLGGSASGSSRSNRYRPSNRVAIFRDREVERKDPDYDRSYDRYMQRYDPSFGFGGASYPMQQQPLFSPAVNYNTEFPQLASGHRTQISVEQSPRAAPQQVRGPWPVQSVPGPVGYGPLDGMMASFNPRHAGSHPTSAMYMHPPQYSVPLRPGISFVSPREHIQLFPQTHQQQSETSFGLARPQ